MELLTKKNNFFWIGQLKIYPMPNLETGIFLFMFLKIAQNFVPVGTFRTVFNGRVDKGSKKGDY